MSLAKKLSYVSAQAEDLVLAREILKWQEELSKTILDRENYVPDSKSRMATKDAIIKYETLDEMLAIVEHRLDFNKAMADFEEESNE